MITARQALQKTLPLVFVVLISGVIHFVFCRVSGSHLLTGVDLAFNYAILFMLFVSGQVGAWQKRTKQEALKSFVRSGLFRLGLAALFLVVSTINSPAPFARALHFIVPFLLFSVVAFMQIRSNFKNA